MSDRQGGSIAVENGKEFEDAVEQLLRSYNFIEIKDKKLVQQLGGHIPSIESPWYVKQIKLFNNLYGVKCVSDFYCCIPGHNTQCIIEVKYQGSAGSADEKYVFTALSLDNMPVNTIFILEGRGARPCVYSYLRKLGEEKKPSFQFMNFYELGKYLKTFKN